MKRAAVPGAAPADDRRPEPLTAVQLEEARNVTDGRERSKIYRILLTETMRRLRSGRQLERAHGVIHPEMTSIVRDALRLADLVFPGSDAEVRAEIEEEPSKACAGAVELSALVARGGMARVAAVSGLPAKKLKAIADGHVRPSPGEVEVLADRLRISVGAWA